MCSNYSPANEHGPKKECPRKEDPCKCCRNQGSKSLNPPLSLKASVCVSLREPFSGWLKGKLTGQPQFCSPNKLTHAQLISESLRCARTSSGFTHVIAIPSKKLDIICLHVLPPPAFTMLAVLVVALRRAGDKEASSLGGLHADRSLQDGNFLPNLL